MLPVYNPFDFPRSGFLDFGLQGFRVPRGFLGLLDCIMWIVYTCWQLDLFRLLGLV